MSEAQRDVVSIPSVEAAIDELVIAEDEFARAYARATSEAPPRLVKARAVLEQKRAALILAVQQAAQAPPHDCEALALEGLGCATCNPNAQPPSPSPTCATCRYMQAHVGALQCANSDNHVMDGAFVDREFGCIFHQPVERT